jgi:hypothetical protein
MTNEEGKHIAGLATSEAEILDALVCGELRAAARATEDGGEGRAGTARWHLEKARTLGDRAASFRRLVDRIAVEVDRRLPSCRSEGS